MEKECSKSMHGKHEWIKNKGQSVYHCICCYSTAKRIKEEKLPPVKIFEIKQ